MDEAVCKIQKRGEKRSQFYYVRRHLSLDTYRKLAKQTHLLDTDIVLGQLVSF